MAYRGDRYHGWQTQLECPTVQGALERACATLLNCPPEHLTLQGASRTDAGVHALGQTVHIDHASTFTPWDFVRALNGLTDDDICVYWAEDVQTDFHARYDAKGKTYCYTIWNHRFPHPLRTSDAWHLPYPLVAPEAMEEAARKMVGEHDFAAFRAAGCQATTTLRHLRHLSLTWESPCLLKVHVEGTAFLKYMVRILVGTLVSVGLGRLDPAVVDRMLQTGTRELGGPTAPPHGLTLLAVHYPDHPWQTPTGAAPELGGPWSPSDAW